MTNCDETKPSPDSIKDYRTILLEIRGIGSVPSFKNSKQISLNRKTGKRFLRTDPKKKEWMENAIQLIASQLLGMFQTDECETHGGCQRQSLMLSSLPCDDSLDWMIPGDQQVVRVPHGNEGCTILIERL